MLVTCFNNRSFRVFKETFRFFLNRSKVCLNHEKLENISSKDVFESRKSNHALLTRYSPLE